MSSLKRARRNTFGSAFLKAHKIERKSHFIKYNKYINRMKKSIEEF